MLGVDSDNDSAFMSQGVFDYCKGHGLEQTRLRAYKDLISKNVQPGSCHEPVGQEDGL